MLYHFQFHQSIKGLIWGNPSNAQLISSQNRTTHILSHPISNQIQRQLHKKTNPNSKITIPNHKTKKQIKTLKKKAYFILSEAELNNTTRIPLRLIRILRNPTQTGVIRVIRLFVNGIRPGGERRGASGNPRREVRAGEGPLEAIGGRGGRRRGAVALEVELEEVEESAGDGGAEEEASPALDYALERDDDSHASSGATFAGGGGGARWGIGGGGAAAARGEGHGWEEGGSMDFQSGRMRDAEMGEENKAPRGVTTRSLFFFFFLIIIVFYKINLIS